METSGVRWSEAERGIWEPLGFCPIISCGCVLTQEKVGVTSLAVHPFKLLSDGQVCPPQGMNKDNGRTGQQSPEKRAMGCVCMCTCSRVCACRTHSWSWAGTPATQSHVCRRAGAVGELLHQVEVAQDTLQRWPQPSCHLQTVQPPQLTSIYEVGTRLTGRGSQSNLGNTSTCL